MVEGKLASGICHILRVDGVLRLRGRVLPAALCVGVADEQGFHLAQKIAGAERFDEQGLRVFSG